jgi:hypothetical protein
MDTDRGKDKDMDRDTDWYTDRDTDWYTDRNTDRDTDLVIFSLGEKIRQLKKVYTKTVFNLVYKTRSKSRSLIRRFKRKLPYFSVFITHVTV